MLDTIKEFFTYGLGAFFALLGFAFPVLVLHGVVQLLRGIVDAIKGDKKDV